MTTCWRSLLSFFIIVAVVGYTNAAITAEEFRDNVAKGLRLIEKDPGVEPMWMTQEEKFEFMKKDRNFFDVTHTYDPTAALGTVLSGAGSRKPKYTTGDTIPYPRPSNQKAVESLLPGISLANMQSYLGNLTAFHNRFFMTESGAAASLWIRDTVAQIASTSPHSNTKPSVALFPHNFTQSSIIARIPGRDPGAPIVILGAHMDSINLTDYVNGRAPGADDDGSGCVNLLEALRVLVGSGFEPGAGVEFHWYAGEEAGLLGSQDVAKAYADKGMEVRAMLQFDMTAFVNPGSKEVISLMPDFTNVNLTEFVGSLIDTYLNVGWEVNNPCGYGCSDHASWDKYGYPTAVPFEGHYPEDAPNPAAHTEADTVDVPGFSWDHTLEFTKLAVAFAYELGEQ